MLHSYAFANFRSFRSRVEVSFLLNEKDAVKSWETTSASGHRLTTALAVFGANASGKTSLLQPLAFLAWFVPHSFSLKPDAPIPISPHFAARKEPTEFEVVVDAVEPGMLWRYRLSLTRERVLAETLERKKAGGRWQRVFDRQWTADERYDVKQNEFGLDAAQAAAVRPNVSLISWAIQFDVQLAKQLCDIRIFANINSGGRVAHRADTLNRVAELFQAMPELQAQIRDLLSSWDLGIDDIVAREVEVEQADPSGGEIVTKQVWRLFGVHRRGTETYELPFSEESSGTRAAFILLAHFLPALQLGALIVYDELDSDLHPLLIPEIVGLFSKPEINRNRAQIIFTCHSPEILRRLQKSQIMLVEKNSLESRSWRLDSVKGVRSDENRLAKYLAGEYGGVPRVSRR
ncbi:MAG TPA: ATP-binding protein [Steroidobacter sp.]